MQKKYDVYKLMSNTIFMYLNLVVGLHSLGIKRGVWFVRLFKVKKFDLRTYVLPVFEITL